MNKKVLSVNLLILISFIFLFITGCSKSFNFSDKENTWEIELLQEQLKQSENHSKKLEQELSNNKELISKYKNLQALFDRQSGLNQNMTSEINRLKKELEEVKKDNVHLRKLNIELVSFQKEKSQKNKQKTIIETKSNKSCKITCFNDCMEKNCKDFDMKECLETFNKEACDDFPLECEENCRKTSSKCIEWEKCPIVPPIAGKPLIYLYPTKKQKINVNLNFKGEFIATYPKIKNNNSWEIIANPKWELINKEDGKVYSYLFWEGNFDKFNVFDKIKNWFVVKWENTVKFLQEKLSYLGLNPKEYNEFIVYRYPLMKNNPYNLIYFADEDYKNLAKLSISPTPDSILRVFMVFKPLSMPIKIPEQKLKPFQRTWFSVIEWWGTEIK